MPRRVSFVPSSAFTDGGAGGGATSLDGLDDVTITSPADGQVIARSGSAWVNTPAPSGGGGIKSVSLRRRTSGNLTVPSYMTAGMVDVDASTLEATNAAAAGDLLSITISGFADQLGTVAADHSDVGFDVAFMVGTARVRRLSGTTTMNSSAGIGGWIAPWGQHSQVGGTAFMMVTADMLDGANVRSRLLYGSYHPGKRLLYSVETNPLMLQVVNYGPVG